MSIGIFDDILGPDEDEEEFLELSEEELEELFEDDLGEKLRKLQRDKWNGKKVWIPEREMNG